MFLIHLQGAFATLSYSDRWECQRAGIENTKLKGVYQNQIRKKGKKSVDRFFQKPNVRKAIKLLEQRPETSCRQLAKLVGLHRTTTGKVRALAAMLRTL